MMLHRLINSIFPILFCGIDVVIDADHTNAIVHSRFDQFTTSCQMPKQAAAVLDHNQGPATDCDSITHLVDPRPGCQFAR
jgi:hypothetical protein